MTGNLTEIFNAYLQGVSVWAYLAAYLGGILASFTPCVYPLIPITLAVIGGQSRGACRGVRFRGFILSLFYVLGVALTYTALGGASALSGRLFGQLQASSWTHFIVANVCILLGLSIFGVFPLPQRVPGFLARRQNAGNAGGVAASFIIGAASGLIMSPCTTPILATLLGYVAARQNIAFGMSLLFVFSLGMGTLLILVGTFAGLLATLPRSGAWTTAINRFFGWVLLGTGEYFLFLAGTLWI
ncbi:MAG: sulfite exporter TauE/SafE family protein [Deltaproteobacteria bacterium]|nr:sulfite exporter TauE/SafE family protein [Deltaproteobacteria bacterium]